MSEFIIISKRARRMYEPLCIVSSPSALRKLRDSVADPKYDGTRTTRKQLLESDGELSESDEEEVYSEGQDEGESSQSSVNEEEDEDLPSQSEATEEETTPEFKQTETPEDLTSTLRKTRDEDRKKGKAVSRQIVRRLDH